MKILSLKVMNGPNIWSNYRQKLIVMKLDLEELEKRPTHHIEGFAERIKMLMPTLYLHRCSEGNKGGFFQRVEQGTWMGHVIEHIALELQTLAGMDCGYGRTRSTDKEGVYYVVFAHRIAEAGLYAAKASVNIAAALVKGNTYNLNEDILKLKEIAAMYPVSETTRLLLDEAHKTEIPHHLVNSNLLLLGYGIRQVKLRPDLSGTNSGIGLDIGRHRSETAKLLAHAQVSTAEILDVRNNEDLSKAFSSIGAPLVLRPAHGNHSRNFSLVLNSEEQGKELLPQFLAMYGQVVAQKYLEGDLFRVLLIHHKVVAMLRHRRHIITANGKSTLKELLNEEGISAENTQEFIPQAGLIIIADKAPEQCAEQLHLTYRQITSRISRIMELNLCAIDLVSQDARILAVPGGNEIIAIDPRPDLGPYLNPPYGEGVNVISPLLQMLFPNQGDKGRIPVVAVRGNGKSAGIISLIEKIMVKHGRKVASSSRQGISLSCNRVSEKSADDFSSVRGVLFDPGIDTAIVECTTACVLETGLPFDASEITVITGEHASLKKRIREAEEAERKSDYVVARTTLEHGFAILNADNEAIRIKRELYCHVALYSIENENPKINDHCAGGGKAAIVEQGVIVICEGKWKTAIQKLEPEQDPSTVLPAALAAWLQGANAKAICSALKESSLVNNHTMELTQA